jgi:hypothetical protein
VWGLIHRLRVKTGFVTRFVLMLLREWRFRIGPRASLHGSPVIGFRTCFSGSAYPLLDRALGCGSFLAPGRKTILRGAGGTNIRHPLRDFLRAFALP